MQSKFGMQMGTEGLYQQATIQGLRSQKEAILVGREMDDAPANSKHGVRCPKHR